MYKMSLLLLMFFALQAQGQTKIIHDTIFFRPHITRSWDCPGKFLLHRAACFFEECNWGSGLLCYQMALNTLPLDNTMEDAANEAFKKLIPEIEAIKRENEITDMAFSPEGNYLASVAGNTVQLLNINTMKTEKILRANSSQLHTLSFNQKGDVLAAIGDDNLLWFWDINKGEEKCRMRRILNENAKTIEFDTYANYYAYASGPCIKIKSLEEDTLLVALQGHKNDISAFSYCKSKELLASVSAEDESGSIRINDLAGMKQGEVRLLKSYGEHVQDIVLSKNGKYIAYNNIQNKIFLQNIENDRLINILEEKGEIGKFKFSPNAKWLVYYYTGSTAEENTVYVFDIEKNKRRAKLSNFGSDKICSIAISPDNKTFAIGSAKGVIHLFLMDKTEAEKNVESWDARLSASIPYILNYEGEFQYFDFDSLNQKRNNSEAEEFVKELLPSGSNSKDSSAFKYNDKLSQRFKVSDLMYFAYHQDIDQVRTSINNGVQLNEKDEGGLTALLWAVSKPENEKVVKFIADKMTKQDKEDDLLFAIENAFSPIMIENLLSAGIDVNCKNSLGETPLMIASRKNNLEMVKLLVSKGADINAKTIFNETSLYFSLDYCNDDIANYLLELKPLINVVETRYGNNELTMAATCDNIDIITRLLEMGANQNLLDNSGWAALHTAAYNGENEMIKILAAKGTDLNCLTKGKLRQDRGLSPLMLATVNNHIETVELLIKLGADINTCTVFGWSALSLATYYGYLDIVKLLLKYNAITSIPVVFGEKQTLVLIARENKHFEILDYYKSIHLEDIKRYTLPSKLEMKGFMVTSVGQTKGAISASLEKMNDSIYQLTIINDNVELFGKFYGEGKAIYNSSNELVINFNGYYLETGMNDVFIAGDNVKTKVDLIFSQKKIKGLFFIEKDVHRDYEQSGTIELKIKKKGINR